MIRELFLEDLSLWSCVWQSTLLAMVGLAGSFLLRHRPARAFQVLFLAMTAAVLVPVMSVIVKHHELGVFTAEPIALKSEMRDLSSAIPYGISTVSSALDSQIQVREGATDIVIAERGSEDTNISWRMILLFGWMIATLVLLGRLLIAFFNGIRLIKRSKFQSCEHIEQAADIARARLGITKCLLIRSSQEIRSPMIWCWSKNPVLVVPSKLDNNTDWVGVICHELAHWRRWDHISGLMAEMIVCILSWNPLLWWSKKRIVRLGEQACDDWVIAGGQPTESYARSLLNFKPQKQAAFVPAVVNSKKGVAVRIHRILKYSCGNPRTGLLWASMASIIVTFIAVGIAFAQTRPAKPETSSSTEEKPTKSLQEASIKGDVEQIKLHLSIGANVNAKDKKGRTALHHAARKGHVEIARLLIASGADVNIRAEDGQTPLHRAADHGKREMAELLILKGADVNAEDENGQTPLSRALHNKGGGREMVELLASKGATVPALHLAAHRGQLEKIRENLGDRANMDARDKGGRTLLHYAASAGQSQIVELLIAKGMDVNHKDKNGETPLYYAADAGWRNVAESLIADGADVNIQQVNKGTPLHEAAADGSIDVAELLIAHGANLNAKDRYSYTPLHYTAWWKDPRVLAVAKLLLDKGAKVNARTTWDGTPLTDAAESDNLPLAELLVDRGANVNAACTYGCTCLHHSVSSKDVAEFLITNGADVNAKDRNGQTPLHSAVGEGSRDSVELLIAKGADINAVNWWIATPLHTACSRGDKDIAELLIAKGADVNARNKWDLTPLDVAIERGHDKIEELLQRYGAVGKNVGRTQLQRAAATGDIDRVRLLIARGADTEARGDQYGNTALLYAAVRGHKEIVKLLLEKGANIEAGDGNGLTPLHLTLRNDSANHMDVIQLLLNKGANIETRGYGDTTPIQTAAHYGLKKVVELLLAHGAKVNAYGSKFFGTAAHQAMRGNQKDMVRWSISKGVEIPPMHQAAYFGEIEKVRSLLSTGSDVNQEDIAKYTPLHCAVLGRNRESVQLLIENGAEVNARDCAYATPLFWACDRGYLDIVKLLVDNGAEVNTGAFRRMQWGPRLIDNWSNLHMAAHVGHVDVVEYLLVKGADIDAKCSRSKNEESTPLHLAVRAGHVEVVRHLLAKGANLKLKTKDGLTALDLAQQEKRTEIIKLLQSHGAKD